MRSFGMNRSQLTAWIEANGDISFSRSAGPGGQNVNKLNTKVILSINLAELDLLSPDDQLRIRQKLGSRLTGDERLVIHSQESRSQIRNREIAVERAVSLIMGALERRARRVPTRPSAGAKQRRLTKKKERSTKKQNRKKPNIDE